MPGRGDIIVARNGDIGPPELSGRAALASAETVEGSKLVIASPHTHCHTLPLRIQLEPERMSGLCLGN